MHHSQLVRATHKTPRLSNSAWKCEIIELWGYISWLGAFHVTVSFSSRQLFLNSFFLFFFSFRLQTGREWKSLYQNTYKKIEYEVSRVGVQMWDKTFYLFFFFFNFLFSLFWKTEVLLRSVILYNMRGTQKVKSIYAWIRGRMQPILIYWARRVVAGIYIFWNQ